MKRAGEGFIQLSKRYLIQLDACTRCGICVNDCPVYVESMDLDLMPSRKAGAIIDLYGKLFWAGKLRMKRNEIDKIVSSVYKCLLCNRCSEACPFGIQLRKVFLNARKICHEAGVAPQNLTTIESLLIIKNNPYGIDPEDRLRYLMSTEYWGKALKDEAEIVYFSGCTAAYIPVSQNIAISAIKILDNLKKTWTLLDYERCCGAPLYILGNEKELAKSARYNVEQIVSKGAKYVVTSCPTCRYTLKYIYPMILGEKLEFKVLHMSELLYQCIKMEKLRIKEKLKEVVTYHDPCDLARGGVIDEPRVILNMLTESFVEMPDNRLHTLCCGGGGMLEAIDNRLRSAISNKRVSQATSTKANILAVACPTCKMYLSYASKRFSNIKILDITEIINMLLENHKLSFHY